MSMTFARRMILGVAAAVAVATLASGCGSSTAQGQSPGGTQPSPAASKSGPKGGGTQPSPAASKSAPKGGGAAF